LDAGWSGLRLMDEAVPVPPGPVTAWLDDSSASQAAVRLAQRIAAGLGRRLSILLPAPGTPGPDEDALRHMALAMGVPAPQFRRLPPAEDLAGALARLRAGLLVISDAPFAPGGARLEALLRRTRVPLVLLRSWPQQC
jgi:hypothetical protein